MHPSCQHKLLSFGSRKVCQSQYYEDSVGEEGSMDISLLATRKRSTPSWTWGARCRQLVSHFLSTLNNGGETVILTGLLQP